VGQPAYAAEEVDGSEGVGKVAHAALTEVLLVDVSLEADYHQFHEFEGNVRNLTLSEQGLGRCYHLPKVRWAVRQVVPAIARNASGLFLPEVVLLRQLSVKVGFNLQMNAEPVGEDADVLSVTSFRRASLITCGPNGPSARKVDRKRIDLFEPSVRTAFDARNAMLAQPFPTRVLAYQVLGGTCRRRFLPSSWPATSPIRGRCRGGRSARTSSSGRCRTESRVLSDRYVFSPEKSCPLETPRAHDGCRNSSARSRSTVSSAGHGPTRMFLTRSMRPSSLA